MIASESTVRTNVNISYALLNPRVSLGRSSANALSSGYWYVHGARARVSSPAGLMFSPALSSPASPVL